MGTLVAGINCVVDMTIRLVINGLSEQIRPAFRRIDHYAAGIRVPSTPYDGDFIPEYVNRIAGAFRRPLPGEITPHDDQVLLARATVTQNHAGSAVLPLVDDDLLAAVFFPCFFFFGHVSASAFIGFEPVYGAAGAAQYADFLFIGGGIGKQCCAGPVIAYSDQGGQ